MDEALKRELIIEQIDGCNLLLTQRGVSYRSFSEAEYAAMSLPDLQLLANERKFLVRSPS